MKTKSTGKPSWFAQLKQLFSPEPQDKEELVDILNEASDRELLDTESSQMIQGVLKVTEMHVRDVMIPRSQMVALDEHMKLKVALPIITQSAHSRFPVIGESKDHILGILLAKDLLPIAGDPEKQNSTIANIVRTAVFIPESMRLDTLLKEFRTKRNHMAIVVDEYGCTAGLVTIEDVLELIVGDIEDEFDCDETAIHIRQTDTHRFVVMALTPIEEFNEVLGVQFCDDEFDTIGGLVLNELSHMPKRGEIATLAGFKIKILGASSRRIELLEFTREDYAQTATEPGS